MKRNLSALIVLFLVFSFVLCSCNVENTPDPVKSSGTDPAEGSEASEPEGPCVHNFDKWELTAEAYVGVCSKCNEIITYTKDVTEGIAYASNDDGTCTVAGCGSWDGIGDLVLPPVNNDGDLVTVIGQNAFISCKDLITVTMAPTVRVIGGGAFQYCAALEHITLPEGLEIIHGNAFWGCGELKELIMPDTMTALGVQSIYECKCITDIRFSEKLTEIGAQTCDSIAVKNLVLPAGLKTIGDFAFCRCFGMETVVIPDEVTSIGGSSFSRSSTMREITVGKSVMSVGAQAFDQNPALESVVFLSNIEELPDRLFESDANLVFEMPASVVKIGVSTFRGIKDLTVAEGNTAFKKDGNFLLSSDGTIAYACFGDEESVTVPEGVTTLAPYIFSKSHAKEIRLPSTLVKVGEGAFDSAKYLETLTIPASVTSFAHNALYGTESLTSITLEEGNAKYEMRCGCFYDPSTNTLIRGFNDSTIPETTKEIADGAFANCRDFAAFDIPITVTYIGGRAFYRCKTGQDIHYPGTCEQWDRIGKSSKPAWDDGINFFCILCSDGDFLE